MYELLPIQVEPVKAAVAFFKEKKPKPSLIVAPTAFGKSVAIAHTCNQLQGKTIVLQPTVELLRQNYQKFIALGGTAAVYSASMNARNFDNITYATIGSIKKIASEFKYLGYENLIIDEAHIFPRESESMLGKFMLESGITKVLGWTATPFKLQTNRDYWTGQPFSKLQMLTSRSGKGSFFKKIISVTQIQDMIKAGRWADLVYDVQPFDKSFLEYNSTKADFTATSLNKSFIENDIASMILESINNNPDRKSRLIFVPDISTAKDLSEIIPGSCCIHSETKDSERQRIIDDFKAMKISDVINVNVLSVGFDHPQLDHIIYARATNSLATFYQVLGRGTRIHPEKRNTLITDLMGNVERFGKLEFIYMKFQKFWQVFGEGGKQLTNCPMHEIGEKLDYSSVPLEDIYFDFGAHKGKNVATVAKENRDYLSWLLVNFKFTKFNEHMKVAAERALAEPG